MLKFKILKDRLKRHQYKGFLRQLSYDVTSMIWGYRCPLCSCKDLTDLKTRRYLPFKICEGCSIDLSLFGDEIAELGSRQLNKALDATGLTKEELRNLEREHS